MGNFQKDISIRNEAVPTRPTFGILIETYGCQMNVYDTQAIFGLLDPSHFSAQEDELAADVILLNTCSVRDHAEHKIFSRIGEIRHRRREAGLPYPVIGICGCMAERLGKNLRKGVNPVDLVVGVDNYDSLPGLLHDILDEVGSLPRAVTGHRADTHYVAPPALYPTNNSHLVTIHKGCDYRCTYCIVPATRGPQREKDPEAILREIRKIVAAGGREVTLLGQNVSAYHWQKELDFAALLEQVAAEPGLERIRFLTGHPRDMFPHLMDTIGQLEKVCPWLHLPIQSGSNRILRRMKRLYTRDDYLGMIEYARRVIPEVSFSTDFIVGFPGETPTEFQDTLEILRAVKYDQVFSFKYSERPGVPAARLEDDVQEQEKKDRLAELIAVQKEIWEREASGFIGQIWTAVVESPARRPKGAWRLRTANNRKVVISGMELEVGDSVSVRITGHQNTTFLGDAI
ncbi:MAG: tRNA (N6-isopentenyl adenosine(37)-C2)-methylthiotransferase MiaB [Gemmatimonadales bacterium]|nr:tRNA (N6-isopentenyl adenosine(37)-C2)-methylthiotransferase MiaB [Gemmatimonadales bacterium]